MTVKDLQKLVQQGEGEQLEFKRKAKYPLKITKSFVAFANNKGGRLLVGIDDNGEIAGLKNPEEEVFILEEAIRNHCKPKIEYELQRLAISAKRQVLIFNVKESNQKPVFLIYNKSRGTGRAYFRVADESIQASKELRKVLQAQKNNLSTPFTYGENERKLLQLIEEDQQATLNSFSQFAKIDLKEASHILITLTLNNVIKLCPQNSEDYFVLKEDFGTEKEKPKR